MSQDRKIYTADEVAKLIRVSKAAQRGITGNSARMKPEDVTNAAKAQEELEIELFTAGLLTLQAFVQAQERIASALEKIADNDAATRERLNRSIEREKL